MNPIKSLLASAFIVFACSCSHQNQTHNSSAVKELSINVSKHYLNLPVSNNEDRGKMSFLVNGKSELDFVIRLAPSKPDYWVFYDMTPYIGKTVKFIYAGNSEGLGKIYQDDVIAGQDSLRASLKTYC